MKRLLFIVSRSRGDLYEFARSALADIETVEVMFDRRHGEREMTAVSESLRTLGWATAWTVAPAPGDPPARG